MKGAGRLVDDENLVSEIVQMLARYMRANPHAEDTKEGIAQWWLGLGSSSFDAVDRALGRLQALGLVEAVHAADGQVRYRRSSPDASTDAQLSRLISAPLSGNH